MTPVAVIFHEAEVAGDAHTAAVTRDSEQSAVRGQADVAAVALDAQVVAVYCLFDAQTVAHHTVRDGIGLLCCAVAVGARRLVRAFHG